MRVEIAFYRVSWVESDGRRVVMERGPYSIDSQWPIFGPQPQPMQLPLLPYAILEG